MTRLISEDLETIKLEKYDRFLKKNIGADLFQIGEKALNITIDRESLSKKIVRVIPITSGEGIITGFSQSVAKILKHIGFSDCKVTEHSDVWGFSEAYNDKADIIFAADDDRFISINTSSNVVKDNGECTGIGYAAALDLACSGIKDKEVLVLGCGFVGSGAVSYLVNNEAKVSVYDVDKDKMKQIKDQYNCSVCIGNELDEVLAKHKFILDCTPCKNFISQKYLDKYTVISAPGIPLGVDVDEVKEKGSVLIHDVLEIGVVVMALGAL